MTHPAPPAPPPGAITPTPAEPARARAGAPTPRTAGIGPHPGAEVRAILRDRLRVLAPLLIAVLVLYFLRDLRTAAEPTSRVGLLLQVVLLALMTACAAPLYVSPRLSLHGLRVVELLLFGLAATYLAWLQCGTLYEAWVLRNEMPKHGAALMRLALGTITARWLLLIIAYGAVIPNTPRRCALVLAPLLLMPLLITVAAGTGQREFAAASAPATVPMAAALAAVGGAALFACGQLNTLPPQALESELIGQYQLERPLRQGGMGEVHLAEHVLLKRRCALKLIRPEQARDPVVRGRFEREARAMASLRHPNAVAVHDCGQTPDGTLYYVMEYLPGLGLEDLVARDGRLPPGRVVYLLLQLCDALREAHALGLLHLDIKPGNVIVGEEAGAGDVVKLLDFGLARELAPGGLDLNASGGERSAGSPQYMAPEQAAASVPLDARTDLYGLGGVAYFLLTGRPPFDCDTPLQLVLAHAWDPVTPPSHLRPDMPADLEEVVLRCLAKGPGERFDDAAALARALRQCACAGQWDAAKAAAAWQRGGDQPTVLLGV
jgi:serine/threonine-protein kinase